MAPRRVRRSARSGRWGLAVVVAGLLLGVGWIARVGATPAVFPGTHWEEASPESRGLDPVALRGAIEFLKANAPRDVADELVIADPIEMDATRWYWPAFDTRDGLVVNGGAGNHQADVRISARELARLGLLYLNRGRWNDRQLLSAAWVDAATRPQVPASLPRGDPVASPANGAGVYGFNWWTNGVRGNGQPLWPGVPSSAFAASGWNNNRLFVIPDWDMVVVRLGQDQTTGFVITGPTWSEFLRRLGAALTTRVAPPRE